MLLYVGKYILSIPFYSILDIVPCFTFEIVVNSDDKPNGVLGEII